MNDAVSRWTAKEEAQWIELNERRARIRGGQLDDLKNYLNEHIGVVNPLEVAEALANDADSAIRLLRPFATSDS